MAPECGVAGTLDGVVSLPHLPSPGSVVLRLGHQRVLRRGLRRVAHPEVRVGAGAVVREAAHEHRALVHGELVRSYVSVVRSLIKCACALFMTVLGAADE